MKQDKLQPFSFSENEAFIRAQRDLWERVGSFCYPTRPKTTGDVIEFEVWADLPRVRLDPVSSKPTGALFYRFTDVGRVQVSAEKGSIRTSIGWREARKTIRERLETVEGSVEEAILRSGADKFSTLPFSEHMHTPLVDILSNLIYDERINTVAWTGNLPQDEDELKFTDYVDLLSRAELVRQEGTYLVPGNILLGLIEKNPEAPKLLRQALSHFFKVQDIENARRVIGPQLKLASKIYEAALEWGPDAGYDPATLRTAFVQAYNGQTKKILQFPRYLLQLEQIGIVRTVEEHGARVVRVQPDLFEHVRQSEKTLQPFRKALVSKRA